MRRSRRCRPTGHWPKDAEFKPIKKAANGSLFVSLALVIRLQHQSGDELTEHLLVAPEEGQLLIASTPPGQLRMVRFTDVGPGLDRHLYCNLSVTRELLRRIDRELERPTPPR